MVLNMVTTVCIPFYLVESINCIDHISIDLLPINPLCRLNSSSFRQSFSKLLVLPMNCCSVEGRSSLDIKQ